MDKVREGYLEGYKNGKLDAVVRSHPLHVALVSEIPGYATGYSDGFQGYPASVLESNSMYRGFPHEK